MKLSREELLKITGGKTIKPITSGLNKTRLTAAPTIKTKNAQKFRTICPYCAVGCGQILYVINGKVVNVEGDPKHPINQGSLCSKGNALLQIANNNRRLTKILYRAPKSDRWQKKSWDWALERIARKIKETRDKNWVESDGGFTVNRTEAIAALGGAALDNEECYLYSKLARSLGIVYFEHQARI